jgi:hypothetical protein
MAPLSIRYIFSEEGSFFCRYHFFSESSYTSPCMMIPDPFKKTVIYRSLEDLTVGLFVVASEPDMVK